MTFLDLFAGIGGFRRGMELAGHKCLGFCEWDKYARMSYISMHCITDEQRAYLATLDMSKRQKEILKDEYLNGEWCSTDIRTVDARNIPRADCWCFGAPCQSFSIAGERTGLDGKSGLIREVFRILGEIKEEDRPKWLIYENVKGMFSSNKGFDYLTILLAMDELGYDCQWQLLNTKDFGVPQNRERVYTVGCLRGRGGSEVFPLSQSNETNSIPVDQVGKDGTSKRDNPNQYRVYGVGGISPALNCMEGGGREPHIPITMSRFGIRGQNDSSCSECKGLQRAVSARYDRSFGIDKNVGGQPRTVANTITAREDRGVSNQKQTGTAIAIPIGKL